MWMNDYTKYTEKKNWTKINPVIKQDGEIRMDEETYKKLQEHLKDQVKKANEEYDVNIEYKTEELKPKTKRIPEEYNKREEKNLVIEGDTSNIFHFLKYMINDVKIIKGIKLKFPRTETREVISTLSKSNILNTGLKINIELNEELILDIYQ